MAELRTFDVGATLATFNISNFYKEVFLYNVKQHGDLEKF